MKVCLWGTRGSLARSGPETIEYGGDTSSVEVRTGDGSLVILDAGSGIVRLGENIGDPPQRIDILLSHLHMDHIQGLGFFTPLYDPDTEVHIWGPTSATMGLHDRLTRYLSPPLFPVRVRDLEGVVLHNLAPGTMQLGELKVTSKMVTHPGLTFGFRLEEDDGTVAYISDHEPGLGVPDFPRDETWTSGFELADGADLLIHDAQYSQQEYADRVGWGHSTLQQAADFAELSGVGRMVTFHHDPSHSDEFLDSFTASVSSASVPICGGKVGQSFEVG